VRDVDPFFGGFFTPQRKAQVARLRLVVESSGFVVTTPSHRRGVAHRSSPLLDGRELEADVLGPNRDADLAVLKVAAKGLRRCRSGKSSDLLIGETVVAIGNPFGSRTPSPRACCRRSAAPCLPSAASACSPDFLQGRCLDQPGNSACRSSTSRAT